MDTLSTWALRVQAGGDDDPVSDAQIVSYQRWGLLRYPEGGRWSEPDVERLREIRALAAEVRSLPRRALRLYGGRYPMQPDKLRAAMKAVAPTVEAPVKKLRRVGEANRLRYDAAEPARSTRRTRPRTRRLPKDQWGTKLDRFSDVDFERLAQYAHSEAVALSLNPAVEEAGILSDLPFEELFLLLTLMQLTAGDLMPGASAV